MVVIITEWVARILSALGYPGLLLLMGLESMVAPVPSEAVMPLAGFLVHQGRFTWVGAVLASSAGTLLGSLISYWMGRFGGYPLVVRFGKFLLLDREHLDLTVTWFEKRGELTIFVARFIPVVRHFISIPAGVAGMNLVRFSVYSLIGGTAWNVFLLALGYKLKERWELVGHYSHQIDYVVVALILGVGGWWVWHRLRRIRAAG